MPIYPLPEKSKFSYRENPRAFRSPRNSQPGRLHGGIDLYAPHGTKVFACEAGAVIFPGPYKFVNYSNQADGWVYAVEIRANDGRILRYCEMEFLPAIKPGYQVAEGECIGSLKAMKGLSAPGNCMLHFEMYSGKQAGPLTVRQFPGGATNLPFMRRADLLDPSDYMDACVVKAGA